MLRSLGQQQTQACFGSNVTFQKSFAPSWCPAFCLMPAHVAATYLDPYRTPRQDIDLQFPFLASISVISHQGTPGPKRQKDDKPNAVWQRTVADWCRGTQDSLTALRGRNTHICFVECGWLATDFSHSLWGGMCYREFLCFALWWQDCWPALFQR